jgi:hypothetical protein
MLVQLSVDRCQLVAIATDSFTEKECPPLNTDRT